MRLAVYEHDIHVKILAGLSNVKVLAGGVEGLHRMGFTLHAPLTLAVNQPGVDDVLGAYGAVEERWRVD